MAYGTIKVDTITFTDAGVDKSVTISGLVQNPTFSGNITVTGTVSGNTIQGQTVSGATITGGAAAFTTVTGGVATITSGVFALGSASNPSISFNGDANTGLYSPGADQVAISTGGSGRLFVDANGNVGVGTASPTNVGNYNTIHLAGRNATKGGIFRSTSSDNSIIGLFFTDSDGVYTGTDTNHPYRIATNGSERLRITSAGLVGVGTSSPDELLTVASGTDRVGINVSGTVSTLLIGNRNPATACSSISFDRGDGSLRFNNGVTGAITERARITSAGLVGVGTSAPQSQLHVLDQIKVSNLAQSQGSLVLGDGGSTAFNVGIARWNGGTNAAGAGGIGYFSQGTSNVGGHYFYTGDAGAGAQTARMVILPGGNVGIGTSTPSQNLDIVAGQANVGITSNTTSAGNEPTLVFTHAGNNSYVIKGGNNLQFASDAGTNVRMTLTTAGLLGIGTTSPAAKLHVDDGTGCALFVGLSSNIYYRAFEHIFQGQNGTNERLRITSAGLVGVGTSSPASKLSLSLTGISTGKTDGNNWGANGVLQIGNSDGGTANSEVLIVGSQTGADGPNVGQIASAIGFGRGTSGWGTYLNFYTHSDSTANIDELIERVRIDSSGSVGIGTTSPAGKTEIVSSGSESTLILRNSSIAPTTYSELKFAPFTGTTAASAAIRAEYYQDNNSSLAFRTTNINAEPTTKVFIDGVGRVGIGTTSPQGLCDIAGSNGRLVLANGNTSGGMKITATNAAYNANGYLAFEGYSSEYGRFDSSGRLGIGTTSPGTTLSIGASATGGYNGGVLLNRGAASYNFYEASDGTNSVIFGLDNTLSVAKIGSVNSYPIGFFTGNSERARIDTSGRLLVGTFSSSAEAKFVVQGGSTGAGGAVNIQRNATTASAGSTIGFISFTNSSDNVGAQIVAGGDGTWSAGTSHPTQLTFSTTADGASSPTERMRIPNGGGLSVGTTVSPSAVNQQTAVRIGTLNVSQTTISNLTTTWTDITAAAGANGLAFVDIFNTSGGNQGNFLVSWRGFPANATVISSDNGTGLTINFQVSSGKLQMQTTSGTVSGAAYVWAS